MEGKMSYFDLFQWEFLKKTIVIFKISILEIVRLRNFVKNTKCINVGPKMSSLYIFGMALENNIATFQSATSDLDNCKIL